MWLDNIFYSFYKTVFRQNGDKCSCEQNYVFHDILSNNSRSPSISQILVLEKCQIFDICLYTLWRCQRCYLLSKPVTCTSPNFIFLLVGVKMHWKIMLLHQNININHGSRTTYWTAQRSEDWSPLSRHTAKLPTNYWHVTSLPLDIVPATTNHCTRVVLWFAICVNNVPPSLSGG